MACQTILLIPWQSMFYDIAETAALTLSLFFSETNTTDINDIKTAIPMFRSRSTFLNPARITT